MRFLLPGNVFLVGALIWPPDVNAEPTRGDWPELPDKNAKTLIPWH